MNDPGRLVGVAGDVPESPLMLVPESPDPQLIVGRRLLAASQRRPQKFPLGVPTTCLRNQVSGHHTLPSGRPYLLVRKELMMVPSNGVVDKAHVVQPGGCCSSRSRGPFPVEV